MLPLEDILRNHGIADEDTLRGMSHEVLLSGVTYDDVLLYPLQSLPTRFGHSAGVDRDDGPDTRSRLIRDIYLDLPVISANMDTVTGPPMAILMAQSGGLGVLACGGKPFASQIDELSLVKRAGNYQAAVTLGINGVNRESLTLEERAHRFIDEGADIIIFDIANAQNTKMYGAIARFKDAYPEFPIIAGNVATPKGVYELIKAGADCVKVGIGPGGACTTRVQTGHGVPQLTAVYTCSKVAAECGIPVVADGGIKASGDIVKALAAGANAVMLGTMLAGLDESQGRIVHVKDGVIVDGDDAGRRVDVKDGLYKGIRGMASRSVQQELGKPRERNIPEGEEGYVPYLGPGRDFLFDLQGGVWSGMSYSGARTIKELQEHAIFQKITPTTQVENVPRLAFYK